MDNVIITLQQGKDFIDFSNYPSITENLRGGIERFYLRGIPPGGFLISVICGNIRAVLHADNYNSYDKNFRELVYFFTQEVPAGWWGSQKAYDEVRKFHKERKKGEVQSQVIT
ncbi:MAG TPA: hypothetical protein ENI23_06815 [bacterium]|nr:hypothetical protein [bacterium]